MNVLFSKHPISSEEYGNNKNKPIKLKTFLDFGYFISKSRKKFHRQYCLSQEGEVEIKMLQVLRYQSGKNRKK